MKFLTRLGMIALEVTTGIKLWGPTIKQFAPDSIDRVIDTVTKHADTSTQIVGVVMQAEVMGQALGLPGTDKLKAAVPAAAQIFLHMDAIKGHKIKNPELFKQGVERCVGGWADILNSLDDDGLKVKD